MVSRNWKVYTCKPGFQRISAFFMHKLRLNENVCTSTKHTVLPVSVQHNWLPESWIFLVLVLLCFPTSCGFVYIYNTMHICVNYFPFIENQMHILHVKTLSNKTSNKVVAIWLIKKINLHIPYEPHLWVFQGPKYTFSNNTITIITMTTNT